MNLIVCIYIDNWENRIELYYKAIRLIGEVFMKIAKSLEKSSFFRWTHGLDNECVVRVEKKELPRPATFCWGFTVIYDGLFIHYGRKFLLKMIIFIHLSKGFHDSWGINNKFDIQCRHLVRKDILVRFHYFPVDYERVVLMIIPREKLLLILLNQRSAHFITDRHDTVFKLYELNAKAAEDWR